MLQIYTGNGKGKTTSALGLAIRALGHKNKVCLIQFMKKNYGYGEIKFLKKINNIDVFQYGTPEFVDIDNPKQIDLTEAENALGKANEVLESRKYDIVILDEINVALDFNLISLNSVLDLIKYKDDTELIFTGRNADAKLIEKADLVTDMKEVKHYYQKGIQARKGIEF